MTPQDTLATLDMNGVDPHKFRRLDAWVTAAAAIATVSQATAASEEASSTGPLLLGHKGPNHMRAEVAKRGDDGHYFVGFLFPTWLSGARL